MTTLPSNRFMICSDNRDTSGAVDQLDHELFGFDVVTGRKDDGTGVVWRKVLYPVHRNVAVSVRRPVHGLAKTSAGRSGIRSLAFHTAACSALPQSSYSRTTRSAASRSRDRSSTAIFAWRSFIPS